MLTTTTNKEGRATAKDPLERERLLQENLPEVRYIARRIHDRIPSHVPFDDLVHAGILGLIDAVDKFDASRNVQLKSYAQFRIRGAILDSLRQMDWGPRALRRQARKIEEAQRELAAKLGRAGSEPEIAGQMGITLEEYQQLIGELRGLDLGSLQAGTSEESPENPHVSVTAKEEEDPFHQYARTEMREFLAKAIEELDEKERHVLGLYYLEELTMKEVGLILDIGESRVSQIHTAAILRLRVRMREKIGTKDRNSRDSNPV
jgi:RNA polymerase sigma factor for flagellar operon FliA